jgi:methyl-galactoside transport system substrate-binding protein
MMINPVDRLGSFAIVRRLQNANIPVIFFNREPLAEDLALWDKTYYVGARAEQSGQLQARLVMDLFGGDPAHLNSYDRNGDGVIQMIILKGEQGHQDAETRTSEVQRSFVDNGFRIEVLAIEVANWSHDVAYTKMGRLVGKYRNRIELVICNNDDMALGAISRMRQLGFFQDTNGNGHIDRHDDGWIPVVGIDGLRESEEAIADGYLYGTVKNDSLGMAKSMLDLASVILGKAEASSLPVPLEDGKYIWIDYRPYVSEELPVP